MQLSVSRFTSYSPEKHVTFYAYEQFAISYNISFHTYATFFFFHIFGILVSSIWNNLFLCDVLE